MNLTINNVYGIARRTRQFSRQSSIFVDIESGLFDFQMPGIAAAGEIADTPVKTVYKLSVPVANRASLTNPSSTSQALPFPSQAVARRPARGTFDQSKFGHREFPSLVISIRGINK